MTDLLQRQNSAKESEGFNAQSYNYGANNSVAHVIAHRSITAGLDTSYVYENNNLYSGGNSNGSVRKSVGVIVVALITIFGISGMAVIGILGKIIEWFA